MSETLSYQDAPQAELNSEEQESLQIGEQMEQEQEQLLAGKYKSPEDLEKAYLELQTKLGESSDPEEDTEPQQTEEVAKTEPETEESTEAEEPQLTQEDVDFLQDMAGGKDGYESMLKWAANTLEQTEIDMYDAVMEQGNPNSVYFAVQALVARYNDATGTDGKLLTGKSSTETGTTFRSQQELVAAMNDSRYDTDPAYRNDVLEKLKNSNLDF